MRSSDTYKGDDWIGLKMRDASVVRGIGVLPMFAGLLGLLLLVGASPRPGRARAAEAARRNGVSLAWGALQPTSTVGAALVAALRSRASDQGLPITSRPR